MKPEEFNSKVLPMRQELKCYALKLSGNDDDAEDLVQEVMLRLWNAHQIRGDEGRHDGTRIHNGKKSVLRQVQTPEILV